MNSQSIPFLRVFNEKKKKMLTFQRSSMCTNENLMILHVRWIFNICRRYFHDANEWNAFLFTKCWRCFVSTWTETEIESKLSFRLFWHWRLVYVCRDENLIVVTSGGSIFFLYLNKTEHVHEKRNKMRICYRNEVGKKWNETSYFLACALILLCRKIEKRKNQWLSLLLLLFSFYIRCCFGCCWLVFGGNNFVAYLKN